MTDHSLFGFADASGIALNKTLKHILADIHHVICVSHTSKQNAIIRACLPPSIVSVIPNGRAVFESTKKRLLSAVDARDFEPDEQRIFNPKEITIVALTRLVYRKGIDLLAVVLPDICSRYPCVKFLICRHEAFHAMSRVLRWRWTQKEALGRGGRKRSPRKPSHSASCRSSQ